MNKKSLQNNQRFLLQCAALMVIMMAWVMPARAQQHPFTLTTPDDVNNHNETLYWIESKGATGFYAIPHTDNTRVSTTNMPNLKALWFFMDAGVENNTQYYYIVNKSTGNYLKLAGNLGDDNSIQIASFSESDKNKFQFSVSNNGGAWVFYTKNGGTSYWVNKQSGNVPYNSNETKGWFKASNYNNAIDDNSRWYFVAENSVTWAHPFTNSTNEEKHYYNIHNATANGAAYYMSIDNASNPYATVSNVDNSKRIWYFREAASDNTIPNLKYYYIVNAVTGKYLKFTGTANGSTQASSLQIYEHIGNETGDTEDRFQFMVLNAKGDSYSAYSIMPKLEINYYDNKKASLSPGNASGNTYSGNNSITLENGMKIGIYNDRGQNNNYAHWLFVETDYVPVAVEAPTITNNFDGTISLSTATTGATIYYTTNGNTPDNTSTEYFSAFSLGDATVIKAIAYLDPDYSDMNTYNVPKYPKPTISFDDSNSKITITSEGTVYYNMGDGSQDDPTPASGTLYTAPFELSSTTTVKAIATNAGYLTSEVATWSTPQSHDYSQDYLTFRILTAGTIGWKAYGDLTKTIQYSINNGTWTNWTSTSDGATISVQAGNLVRLRGTDYPYATSKSAYSGFEGGTATYDIEGNIHSLIYGDSFTGTTTMPNNSYMFCSLFKKSKAISAKNLILPATSLRTYCYRALFSYATSLEKPCALPATTLATGCYWYMFEQCAITSAPELNATTLVKECYGNMFNGCSNLNYIKCLATDGFSSQDALTNWVVSVSSTGTFVKDVNTTWSEGTNGIPTNWIVANEGTILVDAPVISCDGEHVTITCATTGAEIYYRTGTSGNYCLYTTPITISTNTVVQAYGELNGQVSVTTTQNCEYVSSVPIEESNRSLETWTFNGDVITTPYSVNAIDGHSSSYAKGTFNFETSFTLRSVQPTYLWFQHADQSAAVYIDNTLVEKHWGGYNSFFVDISNHVHTGTNILKVALKNNEGNNLAPAAGDFNFNATLGNVKLFTSPVLPSMDYGYDGFHITATDVSSSAATLTIKTKVPLGATLICKIDDEDSNYHYSTTESSTGEDQTFTTTIENPILWNGTINPHLYTVTLEIYKDGNLYHRFQRGYGIRFFEYVINEPMDNENYTGFLLNGSPYLLRGVCMHSDLEGKANALDDDDIANDFAIIQDLGCNFVRLAHYPHPKEVYDWCDRLGIIVQTEVPCVNKMQSTLPQDYYDHLYIQYEDMVRQHFNHPCIVFWGLSNETTTDDKEFGKTKIEEYTSFIKSLDSERLVGYVMSHSVDDPSGYYNDPDNVDWFGCNIYVGWYIEQNSNNPTSQLNTRLNNTLTIRSKPLAFSEYGCGGTPSCHSDNYKSTTTTGNNPRHDIEYQMWLHEGHIAAIKNFPQLLFTSQWQLFDIAVSSRQEGYKVCKDGETTSVFDNNDLKYLNNKGLVERDHKTKKDTYYLYKAWWNQKDKFVHICGKDYKKLTNRVIKCYTNDTTNVSNTLSLYVNDEFIETATVDNNIAEFTARNFNPGDVIRVNGARSNDTFTITNYNVFTIAGNWNEASNWSTNAVPTAGSDVDIVANATVPNNCTADVGNISLYGSTLTIADGGQLVSNSAVNVTVKKDITAYTISQNEGEDLTNGWYFIASPITDDYTPTGSMVANTYDLYRLNNTTWENFKNTTGNPDFTTLENGTGYLYANEHDVTLSFTGNIKPYTTESDAHKMDIASGYNLIGNPYTFEAYIDQPYYSFNVDRNRILPSQIKNEAIHPCTGVIVDGGENGVTVGFYKESQSIQAVNNGNIQMTLAQTVTTRGNSNVETLDKAIVSFNEDNQLGKFYFGTQNANIYFPQNGKEFAIVSAQAQGEIPVNFKAHENGTYTIIVNAEDVALDYLHLFDNLTGIDVDLLATPSYTFKASISDYESRFRLVFNASQDPSGDFAFIHNGEIIVNGSGTLQVIDLLGRIIATRNNERTVSTTGMIPGVYVLRLIQGDRVRTQKIVIN